MQYLNWNGTFVLDEFADTGSPGDPPSQPTGYQVQGVTNYDTWGNTADAHAVLGTSDADLIFLDRSGHDTPRLINVTFIDGGDGNDLLDLTSARFAYGAVTLSGGTGNDWVLGNTGNDRLSGGSGQDRIKGYGGNDVINGGTENDWLYGGRGNDRLTGSSGNDYLFGQLGKDVLSGGKGSDKFVFDTTPTKSNIDTIIDFSVKYDSIHLERDVFTKAGAIGRLKSGAFWSGNSAHDQNDRIIYNEDNGYLYYDPDGTGSASQKAIAKLSKNLEITHKDFFVV